MADFLMPALGADMEQGTLVQWRVAPGSRVKPGDVVAVVETQKGAIDVEIFLDGVIEDLVPPGTQRRVGELLARVRQAAAGTEVRPAAPAGPAERAGRGTAQAAADRETTAAASIAAAGGAATASAPASAAGPGSSAAAASARTGANVPHDATSRARISPAARARAAALGIDAARLAGTGPEGAVTLGDVEAAAAGRAAPATATAPTPASGSAPAAVPADARASPSPTRFDSAQMRAAIAASMGRSKREIPHYYLLQAVDFGASQAWLAQYNADRAPAQRLLPAVLLLKAAAHALAAVPQLNGFHQDGAARLAPDIHAGWAVALRGGGLVAPAIHHADRKSLAELMLAMRDLVQRARAGGLRSSELSDATVTLTNLGDRGADSVQGVIVPPQLALVGFGRVAVRPWVVDDRVVPRPVVQVSLAADHRASDGHIGSLLLAAIDDALQHPERL